ncbi:23S rRNA (uridine(2479)-2'-O)-methyltransferase [Pigmentiphaga humi]|uniref:23S rRNA (Uridine(2479)-2'-O)-methyltransferase n=1 Tax=Pigmentiphaga humi TaxID=2478468 RepID=A0A3P4B7Q3_9BURK|nr:RNA methyltransferase [Pigmentiphaga humi]VCU72313.1 23S rRNA (uridine(2479)-2'-O)-methyltransferase [Pigmentiphaga humi]
MKRIASRDNALFKSLRKLAQHGQARRNAGMSLLEGVHLCEAYLQWQGLPRQALFDTRRLEGERASAEVRALREQVPQDLQVWLDGNLIDDLEQVQAGQGVVFVIDTPAPPMPERVTESCVLLDRIQDPGNVGSILRTCAAAGVRRVFLSEETAFAWSPKVLRSGQGAHFSLAIHERVDLGALLERLAVPLAATTLDDAVDLYQVPLPRQAAWVFGNEGQGVRADLQAAAAWRVRIPQEPAAESLNVAAAAAVCLFEQRRRYLAD